MILNSNELSSFYKEGYLHIPQLFQPKEVDEISRVFDRMVEKSKNIAKTFDLEGTRFVYLNRVLQRIVWVPGLEPILHKFTTDQRLIHPVRQILQSQSLVQIISQAHIKVPGDGVRYPWHQDSENRGYGSSDWIDVSGSGSYVQTIMAIDPMTAQNGPILVIPRSHVRGHLSRQQIEGIGDGDPYVACQMQPGSVLFFGPYLIHGSEPNESAHCRKIFINGYCLPGANQKYYPGCGLGITR